MRLPNRLLSTLVLASCALAVRADDGGALKAKLDALNSITGRFEQVTINANNRVVQENTGHLWVRSPASFRVETLAPFAQTLVSDGTSLWTFDEDLAQVIVRELERDVTEVPILLLGGSADAVINAYDVTRYEDEDGEKFVLVPRDSGAVFESMTIAFDATMPTSISIRDSLGQRTRIDVHEQVVNEPVADDRFALDIPEGVDVIDDRPPT